jgi:hypothetical protein
MKLVTEILVVTVRRVEAEEYFVDVSELPI